MSPILASTAGDTAAGGFLSVFFLVMFIFGGALYFFPTIVAFVKKKVSRYRFSGQFAKLLSAATTQIFQC